MYHIIWIPKYRKKLLIADIKKSLIYYLFEKAAQLNIIIESYEIMNDHVHLFIKATPILSIEDMTRYLKYQSKT